MRDYKTGWQHKYFKATVTTDILLKYSSIILTKCSINTKFSKQQQVAEVLLEATDLPEDMSAHLPFLSTSSPSLQRHQPSVRGALITS